jgi:Leucine-rich repeat (LRR) protein
MMMKTENGGMVKHILIIFLFFSQISCAMEQENNEIFKTESGSTTSSDQQVARLNRYSSFSELLQQKKEAYERKKEAFGPTLGIFQILWNQKTMRHKWKQADVIDFFNGLNLSNFEINDLPTYVYDAYDRLLADNGGELSAKQKYHLSKMLLVKLDVSNNRLFSLPFELNQFKKTITELNLGSNNFTEIPLVIWQLDNLKYLNVENNQIQKIESGLFAKLTQLHLLNLAYNNLVTIPDSIQGLRFLERCELYGNQTELFTLIRLRKFKPDIFIIVDPRQKQLLTPVSSTASAQLEEKKEKKTRKKLTKRLSAFFSNKSSDEEII